MKQKKSKQKFKPLSEATPGELREAFKIASYWLTDVLEDCTEVGAFSEANLGEPAIEYFPKRAYMTLKDPDTIELHGRRDDLDDMVKTLARDYEKGVVTRYEMNDGKLGNPLSIDKDGRCQRTRRGGSGRQTEWIPGSDL